MYSTGSYPHIVGIYVVFYFLQRNFCKVRTVAPGKYWSTVKLCVSWFNFTFKFSIIWSTVIRVGVLLDSKTVWMWRFLIVPKTSRMNFIFGSIFIPSALTYFSISSSTFFLAEKKNSQHFSILKGIFYEPNNNISESEYFSTSYIILWPSGI